jgi:hypothetical protein
MIAASDRRIKVPTWEPIDIGNLEAYEAWDQRLHKSGRDLFSRSSALDEDWLDDRSGAHPTGYYYYFQRRLKNIPDELFTRDAEEIAAHRTKEERLRRSYTEIPYIAQEYAPGFGVVVNIGYSELLNRVIARVSSGRKDQKKIILRLN